MRRLSIWGLALLLIALSVPATATFAQGDFDPCAPENQPPIAGAIPSELLALCGRSNVVGADVPMSVDGLHDPTDTAVGVNNVAGQSVRWTLDTPGTLTNIAALSQPGFINSMDFFQDDLSQIYGADTNGQVFSVDAATGAVSVIGNAGTGSTNNLDFAYDPVDNVMLLSEGFLGAISLWEVDVQGAGTGTLVATYPALSGGDLIGLGVHNSGDIYGYSLVLDNIWQLDKAGTATMIGPLGYSANFGQGMDFDPDDDTCYIWAFNSGVFAAEERTCDIAVGGTTLVGTLGTGTQQIGDAGVELPSGVQGGPVDEPFEEVDPNRQLGTQIHIPIMNFEGQDDVCRTWLEVQNIGDEFSKAVLVTWGEPGFCPPQCAGPLKVECSGLLKPGSTWNFLASQIPTGSKSGMIFSFTAAQLSEINVDIGFDDIVADYMCQTLFFQVVGDCDDYRVFKKAFNENLTFAGVPMGAAKGSFMAVEVLRHCPGDQNPGVDVSSKYPGIAGDHLGAVDPVFGGYAYYVPLLYADKAGYNAIMYIQNGGLECSSVEIWFKAQDDCLRARICEVLTLAPGETIQFDATDCVGPDWQGNAWIRTSQPTGIAVDIIGRDTLMTYIGEPAQLDFGFDFEDPEEPAPDVPYFTMGNFVNFGPLIYSEYQGWDSGIQVQNLSSTTAAKVKVYFLDRSGDVITTLVDWVCPRGSQTFFLPVVHDLPGNWVGSVRVESQEWWTPGDPSVDAARIVSVATLIKYNDAARSESTEAIAYNLLPEHKVYVWQVGGGTDALKSGVGLLAVPSLLKDLDGTGVTTELAIANVVPKPGFTDFAIYIYDQNGLLDYVCQKLNEKQVEYIDLQTWGYINPGFKGSAIISATFWEHDVFDNQGNFRRNVVGLAGVIVERTGTRLGEDIPGDEAAGMRAIPFQTTRRNGFDFEGPHAPRCPGQPGAIPPK